MQSSDNNIESISTPHTACTQCDSWGDALLNKSTHSTETHKTTHTLLAQELTKIANECGVPTTCNESRLPYRDEGTQNGRGKIGANVARERRGSGVIAAWERRQRGAGAASLRRRRGVSAARERRQCGVRGA